MVVLGGGAVSYEQDTPVVLNNLVFNNLALNLSELNKLSDLNNFSASVQLKRLKRH